MSYDVDVVSTQTVTMAVARATLPPGQISEHIIELFDRVYAFLKTAPVKQAGLNIALYLDGAINMEAGVPVTAPFEDTATVYCSSLPAGRAAHTIHYGPYAELGKAHDAVLQWCEDRGLALTGVSWEVYGHWNDDPSLLRTDVYWLLKER
jgi:effector-binding domain-containing protein